MTMKNTGILLIVNSSLPLAMSKYIKALKTEIINSTHSYLHKEIYNLQQIVPQK